MLGGKRFFLMGFLGASAGSFLVVFLLSLLFGIDRAVEKEILRDLFIEVSPSRSEIIDTVLIFSSSTRGGSEGIKEDKLQALGRIDGVSAVYPKLKIKFPALISGGKEIFGMESGIDIVGDGIPSNLMKEENLALPFFDYYPGDSIKQCNKDSNCGNDECCFREIGKESGVCRHPVPFIVSENLVEIYNYLVAPTHNLKKLPLWMVNKFAGLRVKMVLGKSYQSVASKGIPEEGCAIFAGTSKHATEIGITIPIEYTKRWNSKFTDFPEKVYTSAILKIANKKKLGSIIQSLKNAGLTVQNKGIEEAGFFIGILSGFFILISIVVIFISSVSVSHALFGIVSEKAKEICIMRAIGASKRFIKTIVLMQGGVIGLTGGIGGIVFAIIGSLIANFIGAHYIPDFPFKPDSFFLIDWKVLVIGGCISIFSCIAGAYFPAKIASTRNPMEVLT